MRKKPRRQIEQYRITDGPYASRRSWGCTGMFQVGHLRVMASEGEGWDHVSVSSEMRCPTWEEMNFIKGLFWEPDEVVIQYHPARDDYVDFHPFCLHMWKPQGVELPKPPAILVGPQSPSRARPDDEPHAAASDEQGTDTGKDQ